MVSAYVIQKETMRITVQFHNWYILMTYLRIEKIYAEVGVSWISSPISIIIYDKLRHNRVMAANYWNVKIMLSNDRKYN